jgi:hypothetical protein
MLHKSKGPGLLTLGQLYLAQLKDSLIGRGIPRWFHNSLVSFRESLAPSVTISKPRNNFNSTLTLRFRCVPIHLDVLAKEPGVLDL